MKTLCLFILTFVVLYNPKVHANMMELDVHSLDSVELELDTIVIKKKNPLRDIDENLENYSALVNIFKKFQIYNINLSTKLLDKVENNNTLSGDDLYLIKRTFATFFKVNSKMLEFADLYEFRSSTMSKTFAAPEIKIPMVKAHAIWLTANLLTMEQIQEIYKIVYEKNGAFRRIFKNSIHESKPTQADKNQQKELAQQVDSVTDTLESSTYAQQIILVRSIAPELKSILADNQNAIDLIQEISENKIANKIARGKKDFRLETFDFNDATIGFFNKLTNFFSKFFGNIAGSIQWRKGFLFDSEPASEIAKANLRPMDIILEKSPFVLTDKFIPGHFGHVALYLGTKAQLEEIGMWNHPDIVPYQDAIEKGKTILEAVRPGVRLNSVEEFLNIDEMTIVRKQDGLISSEMVFEQITRGIDQIGKDYDFNFDISTLDKIVCSELVYIVFGNVSWPTRYRVGRATITPDDVAEVLFQKNTPFKVESSMVSTKRHKIEMSDISRLADIFEYELRAENGEEIKDPSDPTNSFWKKETKCYNVVETESYDSERSAKRICKTTYKEYYYAEVGSEINN